MRKFVFFTLLFSICNAVVLGSNSSRENPNKLQAEMIGNGVIGAIGVFAPAPVSRGGQALVAATSGAAFAAADIPGRISDSAWQDLRDHKPTEWNRGFAAAGGSNGMPGDFTARVANNTGCNVQ